MSQAAASTDPAQRASHPALVAMVIGLAAFMEVLDISIANVSLPHIAGSLSATQEEATWVLTSYLVANAIILPMSGWLSMVFGRKRYYMASIALFSMASLFCGLAPSLSILIFARIVQGLAGGALQPVSQAIMTDAFPEEQRGMAFAVYGISVVAAPAIGPTLGGWITDNFSWHWIFLINVPVGLVLLFLTRILVFDPPEIVQERERVMRNGFHIDYVGFGLVALGLGALQIVMDRGQKDDWFSSGFIVGMTALCVFALVVLVFWELKHKHPVINLRLFKSRNFAVGNLMIFMLGFVLLGTTLLLPLMVQGVFGYTATLAGLVISPGGLALMLTMPLVGYLVMKMDVRVMIGIGFLSVGFATLHMASFSMSTDYATFAWARVFQTLGLGFLFIPINASAYAGLPTTESGNASALINLSRNIGSSVGISLVTTCLARREQFHFERLGEHVNAFNPAYHDFMQQLQQGAGMLAQHADILLGQLVARHALLAAFIDNYWLLGLLMLAMTPLVLLVKQPKPGESPHMGH